MTQDCVYPGVGKGSVVFVQRVEDTLKGAATWVGESTSGTSVRLPFRRRRRRDLVDVYLEPEASELLQVIESEHAQVLADRPEFIDASASSTFHYEMSLAPMIAVYRAFEQRGYRDPLAEVEKLARLRLVPYARAMKVLNFVPIPVPGLRGVLEWVLVRVYPSPVGHDCTDVQRGADSDECAYVRVCEYYGVPQLAVMGCLSDNVFYAQRPSLALAGRE